MEERAVCHRDSQTAEAHAQDHVIGSIIAVATTLTGEKSPDGFSVEDHSSGKSEQMKGLEPLLETMNLNKEIAFRGHIFDREKRC